MGPDNVFGDLRAMSRQTPSEKSFIEVVRTVAGSFAAAPEEVASRVLPFAVDSMRRWPDEVRVLEFCDATDPDILPADGRMLTLARRLLFTDPSGRYDRRGEHDDQSIRALLDAVSAGDLPLDLAELHLDVDAYPHLVDTFVGLPALRRVRRLSLKSSDPSASPLAAFARAPWAASVDEVFMDGRGVTRDEQALLATRPFGALRALDVQGLDVMALEGLYPEVTHLRIPAGPERDYATQRFEDAFPALTSLVLDGAEDVPAELLALGASVVGRLRALKVRLGDVYSFGSTPYTDDAGAELTRWCAGLERVAFVAPAAAEMMYLNGDDPLRWLVDAPLRALTFEPLAVFDARAFIDRRGGLPERAFGCVTVGREGFGHLTTLRDLSFFHHNATMSSRDGFDVAFPDLERLSLVLSERSKYRATPQQLEKTWARARREWMKRLTRTTLHTFTLFDDNLGLSNADLLELHSHAERSGTTRLEVWSGGASDEVDDAFRNGSVPYVRVRRRHFNPLRLGNYVGALTSWRHPDPGSVR